MKLLEDIKIENGSFRDPSGFVFSKGGCIFRQINNCYKNDFELLLSSGLHENLLRQHLIIPHEDQGFDFSGNQEIYKVIKPEVVPFISYPYEWCFSQLKHAALATLKIQRTALAHGLTLKDASAFNIQFKNGLPLLIDTLSFEKYEAGTPWVAYRQFCQHFLAPLALMWGKDLALGQMSKVYLDGPPLPLASSLLPSRTWFNFGLLLHIHIHSIFQKNFSDKNLGQKRKSISKNSFLGLIDSLEKTVRSLRLAQRKTIWSDYYDQTNYSDAAFSNKRALVAHYLKEIKPEVVWDVGANVGVFSEIACRAGAKTVSIDFDPLTVEKNYLRAKKRNLQGYLPLVIDIANPTSGIGWDNRERASFKNRGPTDTLLALALVHHLAISNNIPFPKIAEFFKKLCESLIIEFVPKNDSQVKRLLSHREDIFHGYNRENFENSFRKYFTIKKREPIPGTERTLYLMV